MGISPRNGILGADVAGVIMGKGENIKDFTVGDEVVADLANFGFGGYAEYVAAKSVAFIKKPDTLSFTDAAALPLAGVSAYQAIKPFLKGLEKRNVLIIGASGGVGHYIVQIAVLFGAKVDVVCSTRNLDNARALGIRRAFDYKKGELPNASEQYDLVFVINGNYGTGYFKKLLKQTGKCIVIGGSLSQIFRAMLMGILNPVSRKKTGLFSAKTNAEDLAFIVKLASEGKIKPIIERIIKLEEVPEMMLYASQGHVKGKIIIDNH
jgi:NADPH:quinone reductase-like Zn-dependent oxidoreductase